MPQSLARVLVHLVFSTKDRDPLIARNIRPELHAYLGGVLDRVGCPPLRVGGTADHVHILFSISRTRPIADVVEQTKKGSSTETAPYPACHQNSGTPSCFIHLRSRRCRPSADTLNAKRSITAHRVFQTSSADCSAAINSPTMNATCGTESSRSSRAFANSPNGATSLQPRATPWVLIRRARARTERESVT